MESCPPSRGIRTLRANVRETDVLARWVIAPQELPVGVLTAVLGGGYLLWLMHRRTGQGGVL